MAAALRAVNVCVRTRPCAFDDDIQIHVPANDGTDASSPSVTLRLHTNEGSRASVQTYKYHSILHNSSQEGVYSSVCAPIVQAAMAGTNGTIMAYGQTGAGKSYTMIGDVRSFASRGVTPRAIGHIFAAVSAKPEVEYSIAVSYMEIYNDRISDLLETSRYADSVRGSLAPPAGRAVDYSVVEDPVHGVLVRGLTLIPVGSEEDALNALFSGETARTTAEHSLNKCSNRAHCIFTLHVRQRSRLGSGKEKITVSKLHCVDLAGSERLKKTDTAGGGMDSETAKESMSINRTLAYLEQCIVALNTPARTHVPYRSCKLTNVLKDALGGNCITALIACVWGEKRHMEETVSTLRLAGRMMNVHNDVTGGGVVMDEHELVRKYERTIAQLQQELQMHDALAERGDVTYTEYTPEQQAALASKLRAYVAAETEDAEAAALKIESVQQMREILRAAKHMIKQAVVDTEERLRSTYAFHPRDAAASPALASKRGPGATIASPTVPAFAFAPDASHVHAPHAPVAHVGDLDDHASGLSLGIAPTHARPQSQLLPTALAGRMMTSASPARAHSPSPPVHTPHRGGRSPAESLAPLPAVSADVNAAWKTYRATAGAEAFAEIGRVRAALAERKAAAYALVKDVNAAKQRIDAVTLQLVEWRAAAASTTTASTGAPKTAASAAKRPGSTLTTSAAAAAAVVDEDTKLNASLAEAKQNYKRCREAFDASKDAVDACTADVDARTAKALQAFDEWYARSHGGSTARGREPKLPVGTLAALAATGGSSSPTHALTFSPMRTGSASATFRAGATGRAHGDILDDAEAFEKLEKERVQPESLPFFNATKKLRQGARPRPRASASP